MPDWFVGLMLAVLTTAVGLLGYADRIGKTRQHAADTALLARPELPDSGRDGACPSCRGRHCRSWRELGAPCPQQCAPRLGTTLWSSIGRHAPATVAVAAVPGRWNPLPLRTRVLLAPTWWSQRAGRPIHLGQRKVALP